MFSAKHKVDSFAKKHTHHTTGRSGGERSESLDSHGRKQAHQTTGEEEDLPDLSNMQVLLLQSDSHVPECWQLWYWHKTASLVLPDMMSTEWGWLWG